jgi:hypothetical protein
MILLRFCSSVSSAANLGGPEGCLVVGLPAWRCRHRPTGQGQGHEYVVYGIYSKYFYFSKGGNPTTKTCKLTINRHG